MSRSLLHDWEYNIERCCRENLPCEMTEIAEDIYNTAYARGKNHSDVADILGKIKAEIEDIYCGQYCENPYKAASVREMALEIIDKYKTESEVV